MSVNGTLVEAKMRRFKGECAHFIKPSLSLLVEQEYGGLHKQRWA